MDLSKYVTIVDTFKNNYIQEFLHVENTKSKTTPK